MTIPSLALILAGSALGHPVYPVRNAADHYLAAVPGGREFCGGLTSANAEVKDRAERIARSLPRAANVPAVWRRFAATIAPQPAPGTAKR